MAHPSSVLTLRRAMASREGTRPTEDAIRRGLRVWAVERFDWHRPETTMVFGKSRSDALRRAQAPGRLGESFADTRWRAAEVVGGWDEVVVWPLDALETRA